MPYGIPLIAHASSHSERTAIADDQGQFTYQQLLDTSARVAAALLAGGDDLREARVAFMAPPGFQHVAVQWGIWRAGGIAVPLAVMYPAAELAYTIEDSQATIVVAHAEFVEALAPLATERQLRFLTTDDLIDSADGELAGGALPTVEAGRRAMILYTSGTTSRPKGVVSTHQTIAAQILALVDAWQWTADDRILHVLPLHHVHGIINVLSCALWSGATCEMLPKFDAERVWQRLANSPDLTLFMAVPTIYARLIAAWQRMPEELQQQLSAGCRRLRLMVSGSAALPVATLEKWRTISGHTLLERYGMTEIGMALSNSYEGERHPGCVGAPLPGVEIRLVDEHGKVVERCDVDEPGKPGEIHVKGPCVFSEYWRRPEATQQAFTDDGWFKTGDIARNVDGVYRILGRDSVDIIKTGGYKVSALEIEEVLRTHEAIDQCAVVGVDDEEWGQIVAAAVVPAAGASLSLDELRGWSKDRLAPYKCPRQLISLTDLPHNAMGKVTKPAVAKLFE